MFCSDIVCISNPPKEPWKLFFGDSGHFLNINNVTNTKILEYFENAFAGTWYWKKFEKVFQRDKLNWNKLPYTAQRVFLLNNAYQSLMDSGVVNIYNRLIEVTSNVELALNYQYIAFIEAIHGGSYSYGLTSMFGPEAEEKINIVYTDSVVQARLKNEVDFSREFKEKVIFREKDDDEAKLALLKVLVSTYLLEHIKFPFSFLTTWRISVSNGDALPGFSLLLTEIAHDELTHHIVVNGTVLKKLKSDKRQGFSHLFDEFDKFIVDLAREIAESEMKWAEYLLSEGEEGIGLTLQMAQHFIRYYTDKALRYIKKPVIFNEKKSDIIEWYEMYKDSNQKNTAAQENEQVNYQKIIIDDLLQTLSETKEMYETYDF